MYLENDIEKNYNLKKFKMTIQYNLSAFNSPKKGVLSGQQ